MKHLPLHRLLLLVCITYFFASSLNATLFFDAKFSSDELSTTWHKAAAEWDRSLFAEDLDAATAFYGINAKNQKMRTPLHIAVIRCCDDQSDFETHYKDKAVFIHSLCLKLTALGYSLNEQDALGNTALHYAYQPRIAQILIDAGASINAKNIYGYTLLHYAAFKALSHLVHYLLSQPGIEVNPIDSGARGETPLDIINNASPCNPATYTIGEMLLRAGGKSAHILLPQPIRPRRPTCCVIL